jgi:hypothetical protein
VAGFFLRYPADYSGSAAINPKTPSAGSGFVQQYGCPPDRVAGMIAACRDTRRRVAWAMLKLKRRPEGRRIMS